MILTATIAMQFWRARALVAEQIDNLPWLLRTTTDARMTATGKQKNHIAVAIRALKALDTR